MRRVRDGGRRQHPRVGLSPSPGGARPSPHPGPWAGYPLPDQNAILKTLSSPSFILKLTLPRISYGCGRGGGGVGCCLICSGTLRGGGLSRFYFFFFSGGGGGVAEEIHI